MDNPAPPLTLSEMYANYRPNEYGTSHHFVPYVRLEIPSFQQLSVQNTGSRGDPSRSFSEALSKALNKEDRIVVVHGAPGTGKTEFLVTVIKLYAGQGQHILVITPNDSTMSSFLEKTFSQSNITVLNLPIGEEALGKIKHYPVEDFMDGVRGNSFAPTHCIIDDASHVMLDDLIPLLHCCQKVVMAGDPKQFPLSLSSNWGEVKNNVMQLRSLPPLVPVVFHHHRRSNKEIFKWSLKRNYPETILMNDSQLKPILGTQKRLQPVMMLDTGLEDETSFYEDYQHGLEQNHGYYNEGEVIVVTRHIEHLRRNYVISDDEIAVIALTLAQVDLLKQELSCNVGLLEDFQGKEYKVVIFSAVKCNPFRYFADLTLQRLEYIISRAKCHFAYVGCAYTMLNDELSGIAQQWNAEKCRLHPVTYEVDTSHIENVFKVGFRYKEFFESCHEYLKICRIRDQEPDHVVRKLVSQYGNHISKAERDLFKFDAEGNYYLKLIDSFWGVLFFQFFTEQPGTVLLGVPVIVVPFGNQTSQVEEIRLSGICYPGRTRLTTCFIPDSKEMASHFNKITKYRIVPDDSRFESTRNISIRTILLKDHLLQPLPERDEEKDHHVVFYGNDDDNIRARLAEYIADHFSTEKMIVTAIDDESLDTLYTYTKQLFRERHLVLDEVILDDDVFRMAGILEPADRLECNVKNWIELYMESKMDFETLHQYTTHILNNFYKMFAERIKIALSTTRVLFCAVHSPFINLFSQIDGFDPDVCLISDASHINQMQTWPIAWSSKKVLMAGKLNAVPQTTHLSFQYECEDETAILRDKIKEDCLKEEPKEDIVSLQDESKEVSSKEEPKEEIVSLQDETKEDTSGEEFKENIVSPQDKSNEDTFGEESKEEIDNSDEISSEQEFKGNVVSLQDNPEEDFMAEESEKWFDPRQNELEAESELEFDFLQVDTDENSSEEQPKEDIVAVEDKSNESTSREESKENIVSQQDKSDENTTKEESKAKIISLQDESQEDLLEEAPEEEIATLQDEPSEDSLLTHLRSIDTDNLRWRLCTETRLNGHSVPWFHENSVRDDEEPSFYRKQDRIFKYPGCSPFYKY